MRWIFLAPVFVMVSALAAQAQEDSAAMVDKLNRLERDVTFLQKQVYAGGGGEGETSTALPPNSGQLVVRLSQMDEQLRQIRGQIEQLQFQNKQTADSLKKLNDDADYRLRALEQKQAAADNAAASAAAAAVAAAATPPAMEVEKTPTAPATYQPTAKEQSTAATKEPTTALTGKDFPNANAHYSFAFDLLNKKKYSDAASSFDAFVHQYPGDPLVANAYYWLGESYYARQDNTRAAEAFRKGFEANTEGQKAPDNLYKLALSLNNIKRSSEACIVLNQVIVKYGETAPRTAAKATAERATLQCK